MKKIKLRLEEIRILLWISFFKLISFFFPQKHWTICERGTDARDNGYWFYRYVKENHPEQKIYYVIDKNSADYEKVREDAVQPGSWKSYWALATAKKRISSHYATGIPVYSPKLFRLCGLHKNFYFLQHGVIKDDLVALHCRNAPMTMFVCGAKPEYEYILDHYGHPPGVVQYTGLARFDQLHDIDVKYQILVMPTWRMYLSNEDAFLQSDYYRCWQNLLLNEKLCAQLEAMDAQLVFYPHYEMQKYMGLFRNGSDRVKLAKFADFDVQTLLKESSILVTDYSSVFFDFAYMGKPTVYYQFDEEKFFGDHYQKGYFDYRQIGFGNVCTGEGEVVDSLLRICGNGMEIEKRYLDRIQGFFPLHDTDNCKRIYEAIIRN